MPRYASVNIDRAGVSLVLFDTTLMGAEGVEDGPVLQKILRLDWKQVADLVEERGESVDPALTDVQIIRMSLSSGTVDKPSKNDFDKLLLIAKLCNEWNEGPRPGTSPRSYMIEIGKALMDQVK